MKISNKLPLKIHKKIFYFIYELILFKGKNPQVNISYIYILYQKINFEKKVFYANVSWFFYTNNILITIFDKKINALEGKRQAFEPKFVNCI